MCTLGFRTTPALIAAAIGLILGTSAAVAPAAVIGLVDQQQPVQAAIGSQGGGNSIGQSFQPTLNRVDAIEFTLGALSDTTPSTLRLVLRDGLVGTNGLTGTILGQSNPVAVSGTTPSVVHFDLVTPVTLVPNQTYVAEVADVSGAGFRHAENGNGPYTRGQALQSGIAANSPAVTNLDYVFKEGIVPEPSTLGGGLAAATMFGLVRRRRPTSGKR